MRNTSGFLNPAPARLRSPDFIVPVAVTSALRMVIPVQSGSTK